MFKRSILVALLIPLLWTGAGVDAQDTRVPGAINAWPLFPLPRFAVAAGDEHTDLGSWSKMDGLAVTFDVVDYRPGGGTVTLHRRAGSDSLLVKEWLVRLAESGQSTSLTIRRLDYDGTPIEVWMFTGVYPIKWQVGTTDEDSTVAIETLAIAYDSLIVHR